jgi:hypothetical protein
MRIANLKESASSSKKIVIVGKSCVDLVAFLNDDRDGWVHVLNSYAAGKQFINDSHPSAYLRAIWPGLANTYPCTIMLGSVSAASSAVLRSYAAYRKKQQDK